MQVFPAGQGGPVALPVEVEQGVGVVFHRLDGNGDGGLDQEELAGRVEFVEPAIAEVVFEVALALT